MFAYINVQCRTDNDELGTFLTAGEGSQDRKPISPVFPSLVEFYPWANANGWRTDNYEGSLFHPWRMQHYPEKVVA